MGCYSSSEEKHRPGLCPTTKPHPVIARPHQPLVQPLGMGSAGLQRHTGTIALELAALQPLGLYRCGANASQLRCETVCPTPRHGNTAPISQPR
ncbi:unnamed protein product [Lota lota]